MQMIKLKPFIDLVGKIKSPRPPDQGPGTAHSVCHPSFFVSNLN